MAFDAFIKIDGIDGESTDDKHAGWIEVLSCDAKVSQQVSHTASSSGGASAEKADFSDFRFTKQMDKASPKLAMFCAAGSHLDSVLVEFCRSGTEKVTFMQYKMTNCMISEVAMVAGAAAGTELPTEEVCINFGKIEWCYTVQKRQGGGPAGNVAGGWDRQKNCKV
jgi:type VI secretion system secreted protein Hcp